jgi:hypothetical protein
MQGMLRELDSPSQTVTMLRQTGGEETTNDINNPT